MPAFVSAYVKPTSCTTAAAVAPVTLTLTLDPVALRLLALLPRGLRFLALLLVAAFDTAAARWRRCYWVTFLILCSIEMEPKELLSVIAAGKSFPRPPLHWTP